MGAPEWVLGEVQHKVLLLDPQPYLCGRGALPVLLLSLLRLGLLWTFGVQLEPYFALVLE